MLTVSLSRPEPRLLGSTQGQQVLREILLNLHQRPESGPVVLLDFKGITEINGSFLKATAVFLYICGRLYAERKSLLSRTGDNWEPRPLDVFPALGGMSNCVSEETRDYFELRGMAYTVAENYDENKILSARIEGQLDPSLADTLLTLLRSGPASASELSERFSDRGIGPTAWNNRLFDLYAARLVRRQRRGKEWIYTPLGERTIYGPCIPQS